MRIRQTPVPKYIFLVCTYFIFLLSVGSLAAQTNADNKQKSTMTIPQNRIKLTTGTTELYATLKDNSVSRDLLSRLPLVLEFSDFNRTEKIARLPPDSPEWDTGNAPDSCDPAPGDITMYAPWGNLAIFYRDYGFSRGLVPLGKLDSGGEEFFASQSGNFTVTITRADSQKY